MATNIWKKIGKKRQKAEKEKQKEKQDVVIANKKPFPRVALPI
jgi:hypothetical protein